MLRSIRYLVSDLGYWLSRNRGRAALSGGVVAAIAAAAAGGYLAGDASSGEATTGAPAPQVVVAELPQPEAETPERFGFPALATKNTTRIPGADAAADAAGAALAVYPSAGGLPGPSAVTLVDAADWHAGIAAASLFADPVGAPILVTEDGEVPDVTAAALEALDPQGSPETDEGQVFRIGAAAEPDDLDSLEINGRNPAATAARIERLRARLAGDPEHIVLASSDEPAFAMPAASWAARSGDPVLFVQRDSVPTPTRRALRRHADVPIYVLGPPATISRDVLGELRDLGANVQRVAGRDPVANAIAFARYVDGSFGWNINDPGHGFVLASTDRPLDAGAAAPLSASGSWGPLLVTEDPAELPSALRTYLLDLKPGYEDDPTRAVYNHVWVIGDPEAIAVEVQAQIDDIAELAPISPGSGTTEVPPLTAPDDDEDGR